MYIIYPIETHLRALHALAVAHWDAGATAKALRLWQQAERSLIWLDEGEHRGYRDEVPLAEVLVMLGQEEQALKLAESLARYDSLYEDCQAQIRTAHRRLQGIVPAETDPWKTRVHWISELGDIYWGPWGELGNLAERGYWDEALAALEQLPRASDGSFAVVLAKLALRQGERARARALLENELARIERLLPTLQSESLAQLAGAWSRDDTAQGYALFQRAVERLNCLWAPGSAQAVAYVACELARAGYSTQAETLLRQLSPSKPLYQSHLREAEFQFLIYQAQSSDTPQAQDALWRAVTRGTRGIARSLITIAVQTLLQKGFQPTPQQLRVLLNAYHYDAIGVCVCGVEDPEPLIAILWEGRDRWATKAIVECLDESKTQRTVRYLRLLPPSLDVAYALARQEHFDEAQAVVDKVTPEYPGMTDEIIAARGVIQAAASSLS